MGQNPSSIRNDAKHPADDANCRRNDAEPAQSSRQMTLMTLMTQNPGTVGTVISLSKSSAGEDAWSLKFGAGSAHEVPKVHRRPKDGGLDAFPCSERWQFPIVRAALL